MNKHDLLKHIETYILTNKLKAGDKLPGELELAEQFGVSRGTLREVIGYLTLKGILERKTSQGTVLREPDFNDISNDLSFQLRLFQCGKEELKAAREILELSIIPQLIRYATPSHVDMLTEINEKMRSLKKTPRNADKYDLRFHLALVEITGNRLLKLFAQILTVQFEGEARPPFKDADAVEHSYQAHSEMIKAIAERSSTDLTRIVMEHIKPLPIG